MRSVRLRYLLPLALAGCASCAATDAAPVGHDGAGPGLAPTPRLDQAIAAQLGTLATQRTYIQVDKPLYQPGETIWFRADLRMTKTLLDGPPIGVTMSLIAPNGSLVASKRVLALGGIARNDLPLAEDVVGGEYQLRMYTDGGISDVRKLTVNSYEAPRLMKTVELLRKAYGAGDTVTAAISVKRATGEPLANHAVTAVVTVDDAEVARTQLTTDGDGATVARVQLPATIARGDGTLTLLVDDGGVTESMQKPIPIVLKTLQLAVFPEGGELVAGVPSRVYFMAKTPLGKPADVTGTVLDNRGMVVTAFSSVHDGMGSFELTPAADRHYHLVIGAPAGITTTTDVPAAKTDGCVLRSATGASNPDVVRVTATCTAKQRLQVEAVLREARVAGGAFDVAAHVPALVELPIPRTQQGAVRVTLFSATDAPLAERLVYHGRGADLHVQLTPERATYTPRDTVKLHVHATDARGNPVKASLGLAVVDDTVLSFADDKTAQILAHVYLEPELGATAEDPIVEPNFYFSDKPDAAAAMDALLATRGYRHFAWQQVTP